MMLVSRIFRSNSRITQPSAQQNTSSIHMLTSVGCLWRIRIFSSPKGAASRSTRPLTLRLGSGRLRWLGGWLDFDRNDAVDMLFVRPAFAQVGNRDRRRLGA